MYYSFNLIKIIEYNSNCNELIYIKLLKKGTKFLLLCDINKSEEAIKNFMNEVYELVVKVNYFF